MKYNPLRAPDPEEWLALDERQSIDLIVDYHRLRRIKLESIKAHAAIHAAVENQSWSDKAAAEQGPRQTANR
jgi:hypothetical protein